ncbi:hypothetical protein [Halovivax sp.]|uniref:hypothetical protein n=1 Tax=Halovivax sp. TaxID=1935978 RepID=UPI0025C5D260|nr:hypothetical protein [Halovivax sp.]
MRELRNCDFCAAEPVGTFEVVPGELEPSEAERRRVVLCADCKALLGELLEPLLARAGASASVAGDAGDGASNARSDGEDAPGSGGDDDRRAAGDRIAPFGDESRTATARESERERVERGRAGRERPAPDDGRESRDESGDSSGDDGTTAAEGADSTTEDAATAAESESGDGPTSAGGHGGVTEREESVEDATAELPDYEGITFTEEAAGDDRSEATAGDGAIAVDSGEPVDGAGDDDGEIGVAVADEEPGDGEGRADGAVDDDGRPHGTVDEDGRAHGAVDDGRADEAAGTPDVGTDADGGATSTDGTAGGTAARARRTRRAYAKVLRLLRNREFPMPRSQVEALAAGAYDLEDHEIEAILERAIERGEFVEDGSQLRRP